MADTLTELTPEQRDAIAKAVNEYIAAQNANAEQYIGVAYAAGREAILDIAGVEGHSMQDILNEDRALSLLTSNNELIGGGAGTVREQIYDIVSQFYQEGRSPVDLEGRLRAEFGNFENSWSVIARDQVAKAQLEGRNYSYQEIGTEQVEVTCAPDACEECLPFDGEVYPVDDEEDRPQYHIQCACMDIPYVDDRAENQTDPDAAAAALDTDAPDALLDSGLSDLEKSAIEFIQSQGFNTVDSSAVADFLRTADGGIEGVSVPWDSGSIEDLDMRITRIVNANGEAGYELKFKLTEDAKSAFYDLQTSTVRAEGEWTKQALQIDKKIVDSERGVYAVLKEDPAFVSQYDRTVTREFEWGETRVHIGASDGAAFDGLVQVRITEPQLTYERLKEVSDIFGAEARYATDTDLRALAENKLANVFYDSRFSKDETLRYVAEHYGVTPEDLKLVPGASGRVELFMPDSVAKKIMDETGVRYFTHDWMGDNVEQLANVIDRGEFASTTTRWSEGIGGNGMSSSSDISTGGGDYFFTRQITAEQLDRNYGLRVVFDGEKMLQRTDWFSYESDRYGTIVGNEYINRNSIQALRSTRGNQETMFKQRVSVDNVYQINVGGPNSYERLMQALRDRGVDKIGGRPIEQVVKIVS